MAEKKKKKNKKRATKKGKSGLGKAMRLRAYNDMAFELNKDLPMWKRLRNPKDSRYVPTEDGRPQTHRLGTFDNMVIPFVQEDGLGGLRAYTREEGREAYDKAVPNNAMSFATPQQAEEFAMNYKNSNFWNRYSGKYAK